MKYKMGIAISIVIIILIAILFSYRDLPVIIKSDYTYKKEQFIKNSVTNNNSFSSEEQDFNMVKSSSHYYMPPINIPYGDSNYIVNCDEYPFVINYVNYNNTVILINMEFKDSGYVKDFQMTLTALGKEQVCKIDLIDCSNQFMVYIPFKSKQSERMSDFEIELSKFSWKTVKMKKIAVLDFNEKTVIFDDTSITGETISKINDNEFVLDYTKNIKRGSKFKCKLEKQSYNSLYLKTERSFVNIINSFFNMFTKSKNNKFCIICVNDHIQTDSISFSCNQIVNNVLCFNSNIGQIKILLNETH